MIGRDTVGLSFVVLAGLWAAGLAPQMQWPGGGLGLLFFGGGRHIAAATDPGGAQAGAIIKRGDANKYTSLTRFGKVRERGVDRSSRGQRALEKRRSGRGEWRRRQKAGIDEAREDRRR